MAETNSKKIIAWGRMCAATQLMHSAFEMISDAFWESYCNSDPIGVSGRLRKLMNDSEELSIDMQLGTEQLFRNSLDDEKPTTAE